MVNRDLTSMALPASVIIALLSVMFAVNQFYKLESALKDTSHQVFVNTVNASYDIIDTTVNEAIKSYLKGIADTSSQVVEQFSQNQVSETELQQFLSELSNNFKIGFSGYLYLMDEQGVLLFHPYMQGTNVSEYDFIKKQLIQNTAFVEYHWANPGDSHPRAKVAYSLHLRNGYTVGVTTYKDELLYLVDQELLKSKLRNYQLGNSGYVYVLNSDGLLVLHPTNQGKSLATLIGEYKERLLKAVSQKGQGQFSYPMHWQGRDIVKDVAYRYYPYLDWIIVSGIAEQELTASMSVLRVSVLVVITCLICIIFFLVIFLNYRHQMMMEMQRRDYLTGLRNRRAFMEAAVLRADAARHGSKIPYFTVVMLDIDNFKRVNDTYGHKEGDVVIRAVAKVIQNHSSRKIISARYGGEEFVLLVTDSEHHDVLEMAESIRAEIAAVQGLVVRVTISGGVYSAFSRKVSLDEAIIYADRALYQAKEQGKNRVVVYKETRRDIEQEDLITEAVTDKPDCSA